MLGVSDVPRRRLIKYTKGVLSSLPISDEPSALKLGVPVKIRAEIVSDVVRQEFEAGAQQFDIRWSPRLLQRAHLSRSLAPTVVREAVRLPGVAGETGSDDVAPFRAATTRARDHVIICELGRTERLAAILSAEAVAQQDRPAAKLRFSGDRRVFAQHHDLRNRDRG